MELLYMSSGWMELFAASQDRAKQHGRLAPDLCEQSSQATFHLGGIGRITVPAITGKCWQRMDNATNVCYGSCPC